MASLSWMKYFTCLGLLCTFFQYQATDGKGTIPSVQPSTKLKRETNGKCACPDHKGRIYNLTKLGRTYMRPRFPRASGGHGYYFAYNPCFSFSKGSFGDCSGDVAICKWTLSSFQNIGNQSTMTCDFDEHGTPQLEYHNHNFPGRKAIVNLHCDPKRTSIESAKFAVRDHGYDTKFLLTHSCACPNGCSNDFPTTKYTTEPAPPPKPNGWKDVGVPVFIAAGSLTFVVFLVVFIWRWINRDNDRRVNGRRDNAEGRPILDEERINNDPSEGSSSPNSSRPMSRNDNGTFAKDFNERVGSVSV